MQWILSHDFWDPSWSRKVLNKVRPTAAHAVLPILWTKTHFSSDDTDQASLRRGGGRSARDGALPFQRPRLLEGKTPTAEPLSPHPTSWLRFFALYTVLRRSTEVFLNWSGFKALKQAVALFSFLFSLEQQKDVFSSAFEPKQSKQVPFTAREPFSSWLCLLFTLFALLRFHSRLRSLEFRQSSVHVLLCVTAASPARIRQSPFRGECQWPPP